VLYTDGLVLPALSNGHDHGKVIGGPGYGAKDDALEIWLPRVATAPRLPAELIAPLFYARAARSGIASSMVLLNLRPLDRLRADLATYARAARQVGVRTSLGVPLHDRQFLAYADAQHEQALLDTCGLDRDAVDIVPDHVPSTQEALQFVDEMSAALDSELVDVQYGPLGPQWASDELLLGVAEGSARHGRRIHMHLFETIRQRQWADARFPGGLIRHLDDLGFLSPRLSVAHGVWLRPDELDLLAERGVTVVVNPGSNLRLRSGFAPLAEMLRRGVPVGIGLDGGSLEDDADPWREIRLAHLLNVGHGLHPHVTAKDVLRASVEGSAQAVHNGPGSWGLAVGAKADLVVIDRDAASGWAMEPYRDDVDLLVGRLRRDHVRHFVVGGRHVVRDGVVLGVDEPTIAAEMLALFHGQTEAQVARQQALESSTEPLRSFYASDGHLVRSLPYVTEGLTA
jgi:cytosine/adenosine deaminase-related metal-dependent hydrolase